MFDFFPLEIWFCSVLFEIYSKYWKHSVCNDSWQVCMFYAIVDLTCILHVGEKKCKREKNTKKWKLIFRLKLEAFSENAFSSSQKASKQTEHMACVYVSINMNYVLHTKLIKTLAIYSTVLWSKRSIAQFKWN